MPVIVVAILKFIAVQLLQALLTAKVVTDLFLAGLKKLTSWTKNKWDNRLYFRIKKTIEDDKSEHFKAD